MSPTLTILTACDNAEGTILRACRCIDGQWLPEGLRIEQLILDGASTDDTLERHYDAKRLEAGMRGKLGEAFETERDAGFYDAITSEVASPQRDVIGILNANDFFAGKLLAWKILSVLEMSPVHGVSGDLLYMRRRQAFGASPATGGAGSSGRDHMRAG